MSDFVDKGENMYIVYVYIIMIYAYKYDVPYPAWVTVLQ